MFLRRKVYHRVDAQEEKKVHLMNRRVAQELGKIRHLNLSGETESLFESWREEWDRINHEVFANLEDDLLGAEEAAEKYRFRKAFQILRGTEEKHMPLIQKLEEQGITFNHMDVKNGEWVTVKSWDEREKRKKVNSSLDAEAWQQVRRRKKVKPGYKKKMREEKERVKRQIKRKRYR